MQLRQCQYRLWVAMWRCWRHRYLRPQKENKKTDEHSGGREDPAAEAIPLGAAAAIGAVVAVPTLGQEGAGLIGMSAEQGAGLADEGRHQCFGIDDAMQLLLRVGMHRIAFVAMGKDCDGAVARPSNMPGQKKKQATEEMVSIVGSDGTQSWRAIVEPNRDEAGMERAVNGVVGMDLSSSGTGWTSLHGLTREEPHARSELRRDADNQTSVSVKGRIR